jgi:hypothetical protein
VLAVGYSSGKVMLCDVENASNLQSMNLSCGVTCLIWSPDILDGSGSSGESKQFFEDLSDRYLPKLPPFSKRFVVF